MNSINGILGAVPGEFISQASRTLPLAETATVNAASATIEADWLGMVRIDYVRKNMRHHKHSHWAWVACRAVAVDGEGQPRVQQP